MGVCMSHEIRDGVETNHRFVSSPPKLKKRESDMNLVPNDLQNQWYKIDQVKRCGSSQSTLYYFKSDYDRERQLLVLSTPTVADNPAKIILYDLDNQSRNFGQVCPLKFSNISK